MCIGFDLTDELFGLALGTASGIVAGNSLPTKIVASLSVALYGIFLAISIPQAKKIV